MPALALAAALFAPVALAAGREDPTEIVAALFAALNETDAARRDALIARSFADQGIFSDSGERVEGLRAIGRRMDALQHGQPGLRYQGFGAIDRQHDTLRITYEAVDKTGATAFEGMIFALLAVDGKLARADLFPGSAPPPLP